jgi:hypothetical protein
MDGPNGAPNPSLYQSDPPCVSPRSLTGPPTGVMSVGGGSDNPQVGGRGVHGESICKARQRCVSAARSSTASRTWCR